MLCPILERLLSFEAAPQPLDEDVANLSALNSAGDCVLGLVLMSERELQRIEVLSKVIERRMTSVAAASVLDVTARQVQRLLKTDGAAALGHKARGRHSNNRIIDGVRDFSLELIREYDIDFGPTLAREKLIERHQLAVS